MRSFLDVQAEVCAQRLEAANARIAALEAENANLRQIIYSYVQTHPAFRLKPVGAPNSIKRAEQNWEIELEDMAKAAIANKENQHD